VACDKPAHVIAKYVIKSVACRSAKFKLSPNYIDINGLTTSALRLLLPRPFLRLVIVSVTDDDEGGIPLPLLVSPSLSIPSTDAADGASVFLRTAVSSFKPTHLCVYNVMLTGYTVVCKLITCTENLGIN